MRILLVEDEKELSRALAKMLMTEGYDVDTVYDGADGLSFSLSGLYDLIILDVIMPKKNGFEVLTEIRRRGLETPVLMLTALGDEKDKVAGLDKGADDYLAKPTFDEKFSKETVITALEKFLAVYDFADDSAAWFDKVKAITEEMGFTTDMKAYKADPTAYPGTVADVSTFIRQAVTGKTNSPDLYTVMQILGYERTVARIRSVLADLI